MLLMIFIFIFNMVIIIRVYGWDFLTNIPIKIRYNKYIKYFMKVKRSTLYACTLISTTINYS